MRDHSIFALLLTALVAGRTAAAAGEVASPRLPKENNTLAASKLPAAQIRELLDQVEATSFDTKSAMEVVGSRCFRRGARTVDSRRGLKRPGLVNVYSCPSCVISSKVPANHRLETTA